MGKEIDLLVNFPKLNRDTKDRFEKKTEEHRAIARQFGKEFFDGHRQNGYGGYYYHPKFWQPVVLTFQNYYHLKPTNSVLDVGCAKGFLLHDFAQLIPGIRLAGIDISSYAIENAMDSIKPFVQVADARKLPFKDGSFDLIISLNTIHNFENEELVIAIQEIERVSRGKSYITIDAYRNEKEREQLHAWNLTAKTILHVDEWKALFKKVGYTGDYYWFNPCPV